MQSFVEALSERNFRNRTVAVIDNGSWAPQCEKLIKKHFENSVGVVFTENNVTVLSALNEDGESRLRLLAEELR